METLTKTPIPVIVKRNTLLLSVGQALYTVVAQINILLGAFIILGLTGDVTLAGLGTAIAWGGRILIVYQSGSLMDRLGRVKVLQMGTLLSILGALMIGATLLLGSFGGVVAGLIVYGLGVGATQQNRVAIADMFPFVRRGEGVGYLMMASVAGALAAPAFILSGTLVATLLSLENFSLPFFSLIWFSSIILLIPALVLTGLVRPDPKDIAENIQQFYPVQAVQDQHNRSTNNKNGPFRLASYPVLATFAVSGLTQGNMTMNMALVPLVLHSHDVAFAIIPIAITLHIIGMYGFSVPIGRWADRFGRRRILLLGASVSGISALITPLASEFWTVSLGIFLVGLGWSAAMVASTALLSDLSSAGQRGKVIGVNDLVLGCAALLFPISGGVFIASGGFPALAMFGFLASLPTIVLAYLLTEVSPGIYYAA